MKIDENALAITQMLSLLRESEPIKITEEGLELTSGRYLISAERGKGVTCVRVEEAPEEPARGNVELVDQFRSWYECDVDGYGIDYGRAETICRWFAAHQQPEQPATPRALVEQLVGALRFYRDEWNPHCKGNFALGISNLSPTKSLLMDSGITAQKAVNEAVRWLKGE